MMFSLKWLVIFSVFLLPACGATNYVVDQKMVSSFVSKPTVAENKTGVYIIRGNNFAGGARSVWVASNENVLASLPNGSNVYLMLDSNLNTVHMVQSLAGIGHVSVDNMPGETVFLALDYLQGTIKKVDADLGKTMVSQTTAIEPLAEVRRNTAYGNTLLNPGTLDYELMSETQENLTADEEHAVVTFYRKNALIPHVAFDIWSKDAYIGSLKGGEYFQVKLKAGEHSFISKSEKYSVVNANIEANKDYAVELSVGMGWNMASVKLLPIDLNDRSGDVLEWEQTFSKKAPNFSVINGPNMSGRVSDGKAFLDNVLSTQDDESFSSRELTAAFGR